MENVNQQHESGSMYGAIDRATPQTTITNSSDRSTTPARRKPEKTKRPQRPQDDRLLTADEFAEKLGLKRSTAYQWANERRLPTVKLGRALRFRESEVEKFIRQNERPAIRSSLA